jgi:ankyrin repeat protein
MILVAQKSTCEFQRLCVTIPHHLVQMSVVSNYLPDLSLAIAANSIDIAEEIIFSADFDVNALTSRGIPPLFIACAYGREEIVGLLIKKRANVHFQERGTGVTALHIAASNGFSEIVSALSARGLDRAKRDVTGSTALDYAEISPQPLESTGVPEDRIEKGDESLIKMRHDCIRVLETT